MTAAGLVTELRVRSVELVPAGDRLRFRPTSAVPPELLGLLQEHKAEELALLTGQPAAASPPLPDEPMTPAAVRPRVTHPYTTRVQ